MVLKLSNEDLVSIILPVYNVESYITECIDSIINLNYKNFEALFIDDGSTDNSYSILKEYAKNDSRLKIFHKENGGVSSAKNLGLKNAKGKYITFIDPDDYVMPDYLDYLLKLIKDNNSEVAVSKGIFDNFNMKQEQKDTTLCLSSKESLIDILTYKMNVAVWNKMYYKEFLDKYNINFYEDIFMGEGFNFNVKCFSCASKIAIGYHKTYFYRRDNNNSATTKFKIEKWKNAIYAIEKMKENLNFNDKEIEKAWLFAYWRTNVDAYTLLCLTESQKNYNDFKKQTLSVGRKYAYLPFKLKCSKKDKVRALCLILMPAILPKLLFFRRKMYGVNIRN